MKQSLTQRELTQYLANQLNFFFNDGRNVSEGTLTEVVSEALKKFELCCSHITLKYCHDGSEVLFNHLHSDQYSMFLYLASHSAYRIGLEAHIATKIYLLNKALHGIDVFFEIELPSIFLFVHPLGTVLGRAKYKDYFVVHHGCTIGHEHGKHPSLGERLTLYPGSLIAGDCVIGNNCKIGANSSLIDKSLPDNTLYVGNPRSFTEKVNNRDLEVWKEF